MSDEISPQNLARAKAYFLDALAAQEADDHAKAADLLRLALALAPERCSVLMNLSIALLKLGDAQTAKIHAEHARRLEPDNAVAWLNAASIEAALLNHEAAIAHCERALQLNPQYAQAHNNQGSALAALKQFDAALTRYAKAIDCDPAYAEAYGNRGYLLAAIGEQARALDDFAQAIRLKPEGCVDRMRHLVAGLPVIALDAALSAQSREVFAHEAAQLAAWVALNEPVDGSQAVGAAQPFYLAYQTQNNRDLLKAHGAICAALMAQWRARRPTRMPVALRPATARIRVGIVCAHFTNHPVWHALVKGWVERLDPAAFELHLFHLNAQGDDETQLARAHAAAFWDGNLSLVQWVERIRDAAADMLIYPSIGMDSVAIQLASLRLAPVQVGAWGHPETTGLPTIDYYLSAQDFETSSAQDYYTEKLIALPHLGCYYDSAPVPEVTLDLARFGVAHHRVICVCAGTPYKYAPEHDAVLVEIAQRVPNVQFVFFSHHAAPPLSQKLFARLAACFAREHLDFAQYAVLLPWQPRPHFFSVLRQAHLYLDTIGFSGFNTVMQAIECDLPVVTCEGRFMRGRFGSAILQRLQLHECVAQSNRAYVDCAVRLAQDESYRVDIRAKIVRGRDVLYRDQSAIAALETFLREAKQLHRKGEK